MTARNALARATGVSLPGVRLPGVSLPGVRLSEALSPGGVT